MSQFKTKHFQYSGIDDFDNAIDTQINDFIKENDIDPDSIVDVKYAAQTSQDVNTYSALMLYIK